MLFTSNHLQKLIRLFLQKFFITSGLHIQPDNRLSVGLPEIEPAIQMAADRLCAKCTIFNGEKCGHDINHVDCISGKVRRVLEGVQKELWK